MAAAPARSSSRVGHARAWKSWPAGLRRRPLRPQGSVASLSALLLLTRCCALGTGGSFTAPFAGPFAPGQPAELGGTRLRVLSWNVAAVNNNPFEYWITHPNPAYKELMESVEHFITEPGDEDVRVDQLFTDAMFRRVLARMEQLGLPKLETVEALWETKYRSRRVVSDFLLDAEIGKKRLASMPDRVTNTIQLPSGDTIFRPTVINCYEQEMGSIEEWFEQWFHFFFDLPVDLDGAGPRRVHSLLQKIKRSKYPAVTAEEEAASVPLQLVLQGVFDAILVNLMQSKGGSTWQQLRREICTSLNQQKTPRILEILRGTYAEADVVFLQEAGNQLVDALRQEYGSSHHISVPTEYDAKRNQNSLILLRRSLFSEPTEVPTSGAVAGCDPGDLHMIRSRVADAVDITLASFHGDTNGLLTEPVLNEVMKLLPTERLIFGLDANTYEKVSDSTAHVLNFERVYLGHGLQACWGPVESAKQLTTFNARTYLQPQLNKAARSTEVARKGDRNPKDFVLFTGDHFVMGRRWRDNTGRGEFLEDMVFPTLDFPSDHAVVAADLLLKQATIPAADQRDREL